LEANIAYSELYFPCS